METVIVVVILVLILGGAVSYIYKAKKSGRKCIGCPDGSCCSKESGKCCCGCSDESK